MSIGEIDKNLAMTEALFDAVNSGNTAKVLCLIKNKSYALMLACKNNHIEATKILIDMGAQLYNKYDTTLNMVIENDNIDIADYPIQAGADINDTNKSGDCRTITCV